MSNDDLKRQLEDLAARLERVERALGLAAPAPPAEVDAPAERTAPQITAPAARTARPPTARPPAAGPPTAGPPTARPAAPAPARPAAPARRRPDGKRRRGPSLEVRIGQRLMAWVGALVIVVGTGFLVKHGIEQGLWGMVPPLVRALLVAAFGAALVAAGEVALRRLGKLASVGLFGAGLGVLYLDAWATFGWFDPPLVGPNAVFVLMGVVAAIGFAITWRTNFRTIGVLSLTGGYLTLWLLRGGSSDGWQGGLYLTLLLGVALALSATRPDAFRALRYVAMGGLALTGLYWVLGAVNHGWFVALFFVTAWWVMLNGEALLAALRNESRIGNAVTSLLITAGFVTVGTWVLARTQPAGINWLGAFTAAVAVLAASVAFQFGPAPAELRRLPRHAMGALAVALWAQAGVLLTVAIALQFDGYGQSIGWLVVGLGAIEIARRLRLVPVEVFGLIVWGLAAGRVAFLDSWSAALRGVVWSSGGISITHWTILALAAVGATHVAARRATHFPSVPVALAAVGTMGWMAICWVQATTLATTAGWLLASVVLMSADRVGRRQRYFDVGLLVLVATGAKFLVMDTVAVRLESGWAPTAALPFVNWQMALALAITGVGWWTAHLLTQRRDGTGPIGAPERLTVAGQFAVIAGAVFLMVVLSFELDDLIDAMRALGVGAGWSRGHLFQLWLTALWAVGAMGLGVVARMMTAPGAYGMSRTWPRLLTRFAWTLFALCAGKWLFGDTLYWAALHGAGIGPAPVANVQMLVGALLAAGGVLLYVVTRPGPDEAAPHGGLPVLEAWAPVVATGLLLWGLSFEIDRALGRYEAAFGPTRWTPGHLRWLLWTALWAAGGVGMFLWWRRRGTLSMALGGVGLMMLVAIAWLGPGTFAWRPDGIVAAVPIFNVQFGVGALLIAVLGFTVWRLRAPDEYAADRPTHPLFEGPAIVAMLSLIGLIGLWLGSMEIERSFVAADGRLSEGAAMARHAGLSIYWAVYAIGLIVVGFMVHAQACRLAGLALLLVTLGKVLLVDLAEIDGLYRVLSCIGVGLFAVAVSVGYAKIDDRARRGRAVMSVR